MVFPLSFKQFKIPKPQNEPVLTYAPGSWERDALLEKLQVLKKNPIEIPVIIGKEKISTDDKIEIRAPHDHSLLLGRSSIVDEDLTKKAISNALHAKSKWLDYSWDERASIFLKAADIIAGPMRMELNAATMLNLSKNPYQAEIDSACELIDFLRFNAYYMSQIYSNQPDSPKFTVNRMEYRPLDGFVFAVTPFNFVSIMGNLPSAPTMMGNVVVWKPASSVIYAAYYIMKVFQQAGLPDGVINFIPGMGSVVGDVVLRHPDLGGIHFTGSTTTFEYMWRVVGEKIKNYNQFPRLVGETGGKDFIVAHHSADIDVLVAETIRGAFEYQGQKCSAASRIYIPNSMWNPFKEKLISELKTLKIGSPDDFTNFLNAVIDRKAFESINEYITFARQSKDAEIIFGGEMDNSKGYFIAPTVILAKQPRFKTMVEEIFGPVLTVYVYEDDEYEKILYEVDSSSKYALTGSIFANDRDAIKMAEKILRFTAGNFYINVKPTGAVVNQQPFGGSRKSGTNDKAGSFFNLIRWTSPQSIKEEFLSARNYRYSFLDAD